MYFNGYTSSVTLSQFLVVFVCAFSPTVTETFPFLDVVVACFVGEHIYVRRGQLSSRAVASSYRNVFCLIVMTSHVSVCSAGLLTYIQCFVVVVLELCRDPPSASGLGQCLDFPIYRDILLPDTSDDTEISNLISILRKIRDT